MNVPVAPPAGPARAATPPKPSPRPPAAARAAKFSSLLRRLERRSRGAPGDTHTAPPPARHDRGGGPAEEDRSAGGPLEAGPGGLAGDATAGLLPAVPPAFATGAAAPAPARAADDGAARALAAHLVESVQVGLDRAGQAEVRFDVADGALKGLEVRLRATPGGIEATFLAEDAAARRSLAEPLVELQRALAERGITVARLEVAVRADAGGGHGSRRGRDGADAAAAVAAAAPRSAAAAAPAPAAATGAAGGPVGLPPWRSASPTDWVA